LWPADAIIEEMLTIRPHRRPSCGEQTIWSKPPATAVETNERLDVGVVHGGQQAFVANPGVVVHQAKGRAGRLALCFDEGWYCVDLAEVDRPEFEPVLPHPAHGMAQLVPLAPRRRDDVDAVKSSHDRKPDTAPSSGGTVKNSRGDRALLAPPKRLQELR
jgi:hypothetical protein